MKNQSEQMGELFAALAKAQGVIAGAAKDSNNPFFKSKYADLASVWNACREALSQNGLSVIQTMIKDEHDELQLMTTLGHSSGQWMSSFLPIKIKPSGKNELQDLGSCLTYLRRYALSAIAGIAPEEDDDGNSGTNYQAPKQKQKLNNIPSSFMQEEQVITHIPDITDKQVDDFIESRFGEADCASFKEWFYEVIANSKTHVTKRKMIEAVQTNFDHTKLTFEGWKKNKTVL